MRVVGCYFPREMRREAQGEGARRGVSAAAGDVVDVPGGAVGVGDECVDEGGLADAGVPDEDRGPPGEPRAQLVQVTTGAHRRHDVRHVERGVLREEVLRRGQVGLRQHEQRVHPGVVGRDEAPVDETWPRFGVRQRRDDDELVGVGDDDALDRVGVVGGPPEHGVALLDPHDPRQRPGGAARVTDHAHPVADHDGGPAELAGAHRDDDPLGSVGVRGHERRPSATVHRGDAADDRVLVLGPLLGPRPGAATVGAHADVRLVPVARGPTHQPSEVPTMDSQSLTNSGSVLPTVPGSSTTRPGTARESTPAAMTIRWSA